MKKLYTFGTILLFLGFSYAFFPHVSMDSTGSLYMAFLGMSLVISGLGFMVHAEKVKV